jgi:Na+/proline symporter
MLVLVFGLAGNWLWWTAWVIWMPLVAIVWARLWRRMQIVTTAELITLRYGGRPAAIARKLYAVLLFSYAVLIIGYITGFFAKTVAPLVPLTEMQILLLFGGVTVAYTMFGGLSGVVFTDVLQFGVFLVGNLIFFAMAVPQFGGWAAIMQRIQTARPDGLSPFPPTGQIPLLTLLMLVVQGLFYASSPTAGEGMTAQRFMGAINERHAMGGQLFNAFLSLSLRTIPLIGLGTIALSLFWTADLVARLGPAPAGMTLLQDPAHAWGTLVASTTLPAGFAGVLVATEVAAFMSTLSSLINWGSSLVVNDFYRPACPSATRAQEIAASRATTLLLFIFASAVSVLFVRGMVSWFLFINSAMVIFLLPLSWLRFFWWRFNAWGELAAIVLGLPASILVWFVWGFQNRPLWQGTGILFVTSCVVLLTVTLLTPAESDATLLAFYRRCRPPGRWGHISLLAGADAAPPDSWTRLVADCLLGVVACTCLVVATNALFALRWVPFGAGLAVGVASGVWLLLRIWPAREGT